MPICFLSHSSKDKATYVSVVAARLGKHSRVYDEDSFEAGMKTLDEILKGLGKTDLFVFFISEAALQSPWVKREILEAEQKLEEGKLRRFFPILIDIEVSHSDSRIPSWLREEYNLKHVVRPVVAARRIQQRLVELSWENHPRLKESKTIFVGRNDKTQEFEERFDDVSREQPICVIASGLPQIGRRAFLRSAIVKASLKDSSYHPSEIVLGVHESVEDFILKLHDLGLTAERTIENLISTDLVSKVALAAELCRELSQDGEIVFIEDNGCIVLQDRSISNWFKSLLETLKDQSGIRFGLASRYRPLFLGTRTEAIFSLELAELTRVERMGLLRRLAEFEKITLAKEDFDFLLNHQYGFPGQIFFTIGLVKELGMTEVKHRNDLLIEFNSDLIEAQVKWVARTAADYELLVLLSEFEFISWQLLSSFITTRDQQNAVDRFLATAICESIGANKEYLRLNDSIRDFVRRARVQLPEAFKAKLRQHVHDFVKTQDKEDIDASEYLFSVQRALVEGIELDFKKLVPSHFLRAMKELYDRKRSYRDVVVLAERVLQSAVFFDETIIREMRYYLCQSLARLKDRRFLDEIQTMTGPEHNFLMGFYYRLTGRYEEAIARQLKAVKEPRTASRARRELVQLYVTLEDFDAAIDLARKNAHDNPSNPFHVQAYAKCLIFSVDRLNYIQEIESLVRALRASRFARATEMADGIEAQYFFYCRNDTTRACQLIDKAVDESPQNPYPLLAKLAMRSRLKDIAGVEQTLQNLEVLVAQSPQFKEALSKARAQLLALKGDKNAALTILERELRSVPERMKAVVRANVLAASGSLTVIEEMTSEDVLAAE